MKPGDLVRIGYPEYFEEYWEQVGIIIETEDTPHPLRVLTPVGIAWFSPHEVKLVKDGDPVYDIDEDNK
jgi:hypothetical protein